MKFTKVFPRLVKAAKTHDTIIAYGGSSSSKTISILQYLTIYAHKYGGKRITISSESMPVIRKTLFPDWITHVIQEQFVPSQFNKSEMVYSIPNGSIIQFIPGDEPNRWHGMRQDVCFFDELFYIKKSIWDQAEIRTADLMIGAFNPVAEFWIRDYFKRKGVYVDHSTYHDNQFLAPKIIKSLEARAASDEAFYRVYVQGKFGTLDGAVFKEGKHFSIIPSREFPQEYKRQCIGLDFGYSVDPTAIVFVGYANGQLYLRERNYATELTNDRIAKLLPPNITVVADSAEPKSIQEIRNLGVDAIPAKKGKDSILNGISLIKQFPVNIDANSTNLIKEFRNYAWKKNIGAQEGLSPKPIDKWNHGIDSVRYSVQHLLAGRKEFTLSPK